MAKSKKYNVEDIRKCVEDMGLDPFDTDFQIVPADVLYDIAARAMPGRYSHWSHGKSFYEGITRHDYRFGRVYELVVNTDPCQAFLLDLNSDVINLMVKAHVYGHSDFFKNNREFESTDRQMHLNSAKRAERVREYESIYGEDEVREVLDSALTLEWYVSSDKYNSSLKEEKWKDEKEGDYNDLKFRKDVKEKELSYDEKIRFSGLPTYDVLGFFIEEAPIEDWKKDLLSIVRNDGLYFLPQVKTKISNEGFSTTVHQKVMRCLDIEDHDYMEYAESNARVASAGVSLNPYWLGNQIYRDIEKRFDFDKCLDVRKMETDSGFLRNYLTEELIEDLNLVRYGETKTHYVVGDTEWEKIKNGIVNDLTDRFPSIKVIDKDYKDGSLLLHHDHYGRNLRETEAVKVLNHLKQLWKRDIYLQTGNNKDTNKILKSD